MSRFAAWAQKQRDEQSGLSLAGVPIESAPRRELEPFLLDNSALKSRSAGLRYRSARDRAEKNQALKSVKWGSVVWGVMDEEGEWLKVKPGRYLPVRVEGVEVLKVLPSAPPRDDSDEDLPVETQPRLGTLKVPTVFRPAEEPTESLGKGAWYHVVSERVALREGPSLGAAALSSLWRGAEVEVFGWDETRLWRRCREPRTALLAWLLLDHPALGPLIRPKGGAASSRPLDPLCVAASEGRLEDLRRFLAAEPYGVAVSSARDGAGRGPLALAASAGQLDCVVRLVEAGADAAEALEDCRSRGEAQGASAALLGALAGKALDDSALQPALAALSEDERRAALAMAAAKRRGVMGKTDLLEAMDEAATDVPDSPVRPELPGALGACAAAAEAEGAQAAEVRVEAPPKRQGVLYEVVYDAVWIRQEPNPKGEKLTKRMKRDRLRVLELDESENWGKVQVLLRGGEVEGWVMLHHDDLGDLIRTCADDDEHGGLLKPENL